MPDINEPLDPKLEAELRQALGAVADALPASDHDDTIVVALQPTEPARRWQPFAAAAALVLLVGFGAFLVGRDGDKQTLSTDVASQVDDRSDDVFPTVGSTFDGTWILAIDAPENSHIPMISGSEPTLTIDGDQWGGTAACNGYGGIVNIDDSGDTTAEEFGWTEMGCSPELMASESAFLAALMSVSHIKFDSPRMSSPPPAILLTTSAGPLAFARIRGNAADGETSISGIDWQLQVIVENDVARTSSDIKQYGSVRFNDDGTFQATGPCLVLTGDYRFNGLELQAGSMSAEYTSRCDGEPGPDDYVILPHFESSRVEITDWNLTLSEGKNSLIYGARDQTDPAVPEEAANDAPPVNPTGTGVQISDGLFSFKAASIDGENLKLDSRLSVFLEISNGIWSGSTGCLEFRATIPTNGLPLANAVQFERIYHDCPDPTSIVPPIETQEQFIDALARISSASQRNDIESGLLGAPEIPPTAVNSNWTVLLTGEDVAVWLQLIPPALLVPPSGDGEGPEPVSEEQDAMRIPEGVDAIVFMDLDVADSTIATMTDFLNQHQGITAVEFFDKKMAYEEFVLLSTLNSEDLASVTSNDLPVSFRIVFNLQNTTEYDGLLAAVPNMAGVTSCWWHHLGATINC